MFSIIVELFAHNTTINFNLKTADFLRRGEFVFIITFQSKPNCNDLVSFMNTFESDGH